MSEDRYQPYQYGMPEEPKFEEPDLDEVKTEGGSDEVISEEANSPEEPQFAEPDLEQAVFEQAQILESESEQESKTAAQDESVSGQAPRYDYNYSYSNTTNQPPQQPKNPKKNNGILKVLGVIGLAIVFGVVASVVFQGTNRIFNKVFGNAIGEVTSTDNTETEDIGTTQVVTGSGNTVQSDIADVAESVMPSVVSITNISIQEVQNYFYGGTTQYEVPSSGSGIIIGKNDTELLIATNNHVVEGSDTLTVAFIDGKSANAQIKGTDSDIDIAIIAIALSDLESSTMETIKVAVLGDSDALRVGETTIAIGNALGYGQSVTAGIVSALGTTIEGYEGELIQTDAAINPGNSGGALLNAAGEVIGINTAKVSDESVEGMCYAIPISDVLDTLNELMNKETRTKVDEDERGILGIMGRTVDSQTSQYYNMPEGVYVAELVEGGGAEAAGIPVYSVITEIEGYDVDSMEELQEQLEYYKAGETVEVTIMVQSRNGYTEETIKVTLGKSE